jgi:hypothetical protein
MAGYNLYFNGSSNVSHITVTPKYEVVETHFPNTYNFTVTKIKNHGRFLGLVSNGAYSKLVVGHSSDAQGMTIDYDLELESKDNLHCYDVDEILTREGEFAVADCGSFAGGQLLYNMFIYVNLTTKQLIEGTHIQDVFVRYNFISKRRIEVIEDPFTRIPYILRFQLRDGVSQEHKDQTYIEIFKADNPKDPQLLDVIDHTYFEMDSLSIADYQIYANLIYVLIYNKGVYELRLTPDQFVQIRSRFDMRLDITRFRVDRLGFNDDINLVMSNENTIYQFEWDVTTPPVLINKYSLIPNSNVKQVFVDYNYVIAVADSNIDGQIVRRTWVFTKRANTYLNAYNVFHAPSSLNSPHIIVWNEHGSTMHIFHDQSVFYVNLTLPTMDIKPVSDDMINKT